ncbi:MAG: HAD family hydrolase [Solirubrobacteraceae bacterium]
MRAPEGDHALSAAFFDLDKTLMQGSSAFEFGRAAYRAGMISRRRIVGSALANMRYRLHGASDERSQAVRERIASSLAGVRVRDLERLGVGVVSGILPRLYPRMLELAHQHQDSGQRVYIVTAAAHELAEVLAHVMAFDGAVGSHLSEVVDGRYTGRATGAFLYGEAKAEAIRGIAAREGFDLAASYAYSDSASDLPMLTAVGHPVVVNPDAELEAIAREHGWEVLRLDPLARWLWAGAALAGAALVGGTATLAAARATKRKERPEPPRRGARRMLTR